MSTPQQTPTQPIRGTVKQVLSGDTIVIKGTARNGPPPERTISFSSITAPKLAKRLPGQNIETPDEPYAWEAREFLRKKLIGQNICFIPDKTSQNSTRGYGVVYLGKDTTGININDLMVEEGLVQVRVVESNRPPSAEQQRLLALQEAAKANHKGRFQENSNPEEHKRNIKWTVDNMMNLLDKYEGKPVKAVIENVRDGSTVRAVLLPDHIYITLMMSGIRCPAPKLDATGKPDPSTKTDIMDKIKYFTECRLLNQDVEIILESINGNAFVGTILHPRGNIAEELLKVGYAKCLDWSSAKVKSEGEKLKQAEKMAKEKRLGIWKDWTPSQQQDKEFTGMVMEIVNADALIVKVPSGELKKIFLASIRPPRDQGTVDENGPKPGKAKTRYDIPWLFEAREFLRKKLIGKKVNVTVDYVQPARDNYPKKVCCTVTIASVNVAEAMVNKGLATVVKYRQTDDQRASQYNCLLEAERKAMKNQRGVHAKKDIPIHRVNDCCGEPAKAKGLLPHVNRDPQLEAVVEYVASGSRLRLFIPKHSSLVTFLLSGIEVRCNEADGVNTEEAALQFTREKCMQRDVIVRVEGADRAGNFIGWLWVDNVNLSVALVEHGLAKIHSTGENSDFARPLINAKNSAKAKGIWKYLEKEETKEVIEEERIERRVDYKEVVVIEVKETGFYCQLGSQSGKLDALRAKLAQEMQANPPLPGAYTPKKGDICAAKYTDGEWYRAKVEKVSGSRVSVFYMDYGNREETSSANCAPLPAGFTADKGFAYFYNLACVQLPKDADYRKEAESELWHEVGNKSFLMNIEDTTGGDTYVTLVEPKSKEDVGKKLIAEGLFLVDKRRDRKLAKLIQEYEAAEEEAKENRRNIWEYGNIREDDDKEFGLGR